MSFYPEPAEYGKKRIWNPLLFETQNNKITINELLLEKKIPSSSHRLAIEYKKIIFTPDSKSVRKNMLHDEVYCRLVRK